MRLTLLLLSPTIIASPATLATDDRCRHALSTGITNNNCSTVHIILLPIRIAPTTDQCYPPQRTQLLCGGVCSSIYPAMDAAGNIMWPALLHTVSVVNAAVASVGRRDKKRAPFSTGWPPILSTYHVTRCTYESTPLLLAVGSICK